MKPVHGTRTGWRTDDSRLPAWLQLEIQRQKDGPWCICGNSMPQWLYDAGYDSHPMCGPHDLPHPRSAGA